MPGKTSVVGFYGGRAVSVRVAVVLGCALRLIDQGEALTLVDLGFTDLGLTGVEGLRSAAACPESVADLLLDEQPRAPKTAAGAPPFEPRLKGGGLTFLPVARGTPPAHALLRATLDAPAQAATRLSRSPWLQGRRPRMALLDLGALASPRWWSFARSACTHVVLLTEPTSAGLASTAWCLNQGAGSVRRTVLLVDVAQDTQLELRQQRMAEARERLSPLLGDSALLELSISARFSLTDDMREYTRLMRSSADLHGLVSALRAGTPIGPEALSAHLRDALRFGREDDGAQLYAKLAAAYPERALELARAARRSDTPIEQAAAYLQGWLRLSPPSANGPAARRRHAEQLFQVADAVLQKLRPPQLSPHARVALEAVRALQQLPPPDGHAASRARRERLAIEEAIACLHVFQFEFYRRHTTRIRTDDTPLAEPSALRSLLQRAAERLALELEAPMQTQTNCLRRSFGLLTLGEIWFRTLAAFDAQQLRPTLGLSIEGLDAEVQAELDHAESLRARGRLDHWREMAAVKFAAITPDARPTLKAARLETARAWNAHNHLPHHPTTWLHAAIIAVHAGDPERAMAHVRAALRCRPAVAESLAGDGGARLPDLDLAPLHRRDDWRLLFPHLTLSDSSNPPDAQPQAN